MDFWIWVIIMLVVAVSKGLGKLQEMAQEEPTEKPATPRPTRSVRRRPPVQQPPQPPPPLREWQAAPETVRNFVQEVTRIAQPVPPASTPAPAPAPAPRPPPVARPAQARATRAAQWREALRDRNNVRNIIIGAEVLGPPKGEL